MSMYHPMHTFGGFIYPNTDMLHPHATRLFTFPLCLEGEKRDTSNDATIQKAQKKFGKRSKV